ncbi:MAG: hypothetical protein HS128_14565 [Ideonella sp.]|nr:hypothetical protein [Ideonella sp.]MCC7456186.1 hypothetical protein [Nitrospira sp.]
MKFNTHRGPWWLALTASLLLAGCGGGIGSGGTGAVVPDGVAIGTVDGFGSVFIGGERCDATAARVVYDSVAGGPEPSQAELKLGQRVEADLDGNSAACKILVARIAPEVVGIVSATSPLTVAGAQVIVNTDPAEGPVTVFDGYDSAADIAIGDRVEVHGKAVAITGGVAIRATRIERKPLGDTWVRVAGVIQNLDATARTFTLGGLTLHYDTSTTILPAGTALANGQTVAAWSLDAVSNNSANVRFIRVLHRSFPNQAAVRVQGPISGCAGANPCTEPVIDGVQVQITPATMFTWGRASDVVDGRAMHVRGTFDAASGKLVASAVAVRRFDPNAGVITLLGTVGEYSSDGSTTNFRVRGVPVTTDGSTNFACAIDDGKLVAVAGHIVGSSVLATRVECPTLAIGNVIDVYAQVTNLDTTARTFKLDGVGPLLSLMTVHYGDATAFHGFASTPLANGQYIALRTVYRGPGDGFFATRVVLDDTPPSAPGGGPVFRAVGVVRQLDASNLRVGLVRMDVDAGTVIDPGVAVGTVVRAWFYRDVPNARWVALLVKPAPLL